MSKIRDSKDSYDEELDVQEQIETDPYKNALRKLVTQPYDMSISTVIEQISNNDIILDPDYQRSYRWEPIRASRFIESLLLNIPIPTIFLAEEEDVTYSVIDGQQRLTTIYEFAKSNSFELEGLQIRSELNGLKFDQLDKRDQGKLLKQYLRCIVILNDSDPQIKFDVFERLNSGSAALTDQEIRNCIFRGTFNDLLKKLASDKIFNKLLKLQEKNLKDMTNVEYVLRFFAYKFDLDNYDGSVKEFFNSYMKKNSMNVNEIELTTIFERTIKNINLILGENAFNRYIPERNNYHSVLNKAVYDSQMVAFSNYDFSSLTKAKIGELNNALMDLMCDENYIRAVKSSTNTHEKVSIRIKMLDDVLSRFGDRI